MVKNWCVTGDTHGAPLRQRLEEFKRQIKYVEQEYALIILGDVGFNYCFDDNDFYLKKDAEESGFWIYCLRGNHEARPRAVSNMRLIYDENVGNGVYYEPEFPHIRYFVDGGQYTINGYKVLTIGGAYSVDKWYRLTMGRKWFEDEQLTSEERELISKFVVDEKPKSFDLVLTHTCPFSWMPTDLFIKGVDQTRVDNTMEHWLDYIQANICFRQWLFGHFHADRLETPFAQMFYTDITELDEVFESRSHWWCLKGPKFWYYDT